MCTINFKFLGSFYFFIRLIGVAHKKQPPSDAAVASETIIKLETKLNLRLDKTIFIAIFLNKCFIQDACGYKPGTFDR